MEVKIRGSLRRLLRLKESNGGEAEKGRRRLRRWENGRGLPQSKTQSDGGEGAGNSRQLLDCQSWRFERDLFRKGTTNDFQSLFACECKAVQGSDPAPL